MKKTFITALLAVLPFAGCTTAEQRAMQGETETTLYHAGANARFICSGDDACFRAWMLTKRYIEQNSDMGLLQVGEKLIETYDPVGSGMTAFSATRVPTVGNAMEIDLKGQCHDMYRGDGTMGRAYAACARKIIVAENSFRKFVKDRM
jgi:hypothetical protein